MTDVEAEQASEAAAADLGSAASYRYRLVSRSSSWPIGPVPKGCG
ncbi:hypothetical protein ACWDKQ_35045 [Saccharopolyspora sp. NPDC000995]